MAFVKNIDKVTFRPLYRVLKFQVGETAISRDSENGLAAIEEFQITGQF